MSLNQLFKRYYLIVSLVLVCSVSIGAPLSALARGGGAGRGGGQRSMQRPQQLPKKMPGQGGQFKGSQYQGAAKKGAYIRNASSTKVVIPNQGYGYYPTQYTTPYVDPYANPYGYPTSTDPDSDRQDAHYQYLLESR